MAVSFLFLRLMFDPKKLFLYSFFSSMEVDMKLVVFLGIIGTMLPVVSHAQLTKAHIQEDESQKVHVNLSQLFFTDREILAYVAGSWVPVSALYSDCGAYLAVIRTRWICPICLYNNHELSPTCRRWYEEIQRYCGHPRP